MLCVCWGQNGVGYHELLKPGETVNTNMYRQQMINLNHALIEERPRGRRHGKVILLYDNAPAHKSKSVQDAIKVLGWELLPHWHWLSSTSIPTQKFGLLQKTNISIGMVSTNCQKGDQNV